MEPPGDVEEDGTGGILHQVRWSPPSVSPPEVQGVPEKRLDVLLKGNALLPVVRGSEAPVDLHTVGGHVLAVPLDRQRREVAFRVVLSEVCGAGRSGGEGADGRRYGPFLEPAPQYGLC